MDPKDEIKQKLDIVELIGDYIQLKPAGGGSFKTCCPFHNEKTPSFYTSREKQIWHCFGCGVGGDHFSFVEQMEGVDFAEALRILGKKAGVEVRRFTSPEANKKSRLVEINTLAAKYYNKVLNDSPQAAVARNYVKTRELSAELVGEFLLGYAPDSWSTLLEFLKSRGYQEKEILDAGLAQRKKVGFGMIDKFRNRLMIPLADVHGNIVGFTGRKLSDEQKGPKYMNSPQTPIYNKSEILYGLDKAKLSIKEKGEVIIVEGNLDVVSSHKTSVKNIIASSGTALTEAQLIILKRFTNKFVFSFDSDAAGFAAAKRGIDLAKGLDLEVSVALLPKEAGKDPDDAIKKDPKIWEDVVANQIPIMEYYFQKTVEGKDFSEVKEKKKVGKFLLQEIATIPDAIEREHWLQKLSNVVHVDIGVLRDSINKAKVTEPEKRKIENKEQTRQGKIDRHAEAEQILVGGLIQYPEFLENKDIQIDLAYFSQKSLSDLYEFAKTLYNSEQLKPEQKSFFRQLSEKLLSLSREDLIPVIEESSLVGEREFAELSPDQAQVKLQELTSYLEKQQVEKTRDKLTFQIRQAEEMGDKELVESLLKKFNDLLK